MRLIYSTVFYLLLPLVLLRLLLRSRRAPEYRRRLGERLGFFAPPADPRPLLWIHAVSLGETLAARPLIERMLEELPDHQIAVTTTTPTGSAQLRRLFGERVFHVYAPWDTPGAVRRCLARLRPRLLLLMETELWPNLLHHCERSGCPVVLANGRLSARSAAGYARFPGTARQMLQTLRLIAAQDRDSAARFVELGAAADAVTVTGSIKFDLAVDTATRSRAAKLREAWQLADRLVLIAASTHSGEEALAMAAFAALREQHPQALLILVPRHPERFEDVYAACVAAGWTTARRSTAGDVGPDTAIFLLDSIGELLLFYGLADIALIGGSFAADDGASARGGHNPLEPAAWARPIVTGTSMFNFADITRQLVEAGGLEQVADESALAAALLSLAASADERGRRGAAALAVVEENRGALDALFAALRRLVKP